MDKGHTLMMENSSSSTFWDIKPQQNVSIRLESFVEYQVGMFIIIWVLPIVIFVGIMGNLASIVVLLTPRMRSTPVSMYLVMLACADTCVLCFSALKTWIRVITGFELLHLSNTSCKVMMFLFLLSLHMSGWLVVTISIDRFLVVCFPLKASQYSTFSRARIQALILFVTMMVYNMHVFWTIHLQLNKKGLPECGPKEDDWYMNEAYPWVKLATYSCIPFLCVLVLNSFTIFNIMSTRLPSLQNKDSSRCSRRIRDTHITAMLLLVSFTWLILTAPFTIWSFTRTPKTILSKYAQTFLAKVLCFLLMYINHGINFYLYCISGDKFRQELCRLICRKHYRRGRQNSLKTIHSFVGKNESRTRETIDIDREMSVPLYNISCQ